MEGERAWGGQGSGGIGKGEGMVGGAREGETECRRWLGGSALTACGWTGEGSSNHAYGLERVVVIIMLQPTVRTVLVVCLEPRSDLSRRNINIYPRKADLD